jgi:hypothetical protein
MKKQVLFLMATLMLVLHTLTAQNLPLQAIYPYSDSLPNPLLKTVIGVHWTGSQIWLIASPSTRRTITRHTPTMQYIDSIQITGNLTTGVTDIEVINNEMWIAFGKDSIAKISPTGAVIKKVQTLTTSTGVNGSVRTIAAIGNTGQLYASSTADVIWRIDTNGTVLQTIPITDHKVQGIYGMSYDATTTGGPYLWVNCQFSVNNPSGGVNGTYIRQIKLANNTGYATCFERDVFFNTPWGLGGTFFSAGGMTMGTLPGNTSPSLMSLSQYSTFGGLQKGAVAIYSLANFQPLPAPEVAIDSFATRSSLTNLTRFPAAINMAVSYVTKLTNRSPTAASGNINLTVKRDSVLIGNPSVPFAVNPFFTNIVNTPSVQANVKGRYEVGVRASVSGDCNVVNDTSRFLFTVTDSTYGRDVFDHNAIFNPMSIGGTAAPRRIGMVYTFPSDVNITSVSLLHRVLTLNDSMYATIWRFKNGYPTDSLASSRLYNPTTAADTAGQGNSIGLLRNYMLINPLLVKKGDSIVVGMTELKTANFYPWTAISDETQSNYLFLYRSSIVGTRNPGWYSDSASGVFAVGKRAFVFRVNATVRTDTKDFSGAIQDASVAPNPTTGDMVLTVNLLKNEKGRIDITDLSGRLMHTELFESQQVTKSLSLTNWSNGMYLLRVRTESGGQVIRKIVKQ